MLCSLLVFIQPAFPSVWDIASLWLQNADITSIVIFNRALRSTALSMTLGAPMLWPLIITVFACLPGLSWQNQIVHQTCTKFSMFCEQQPQRWLSSNPQRYLAAKSGWVAVLQHPMVCL